MKIFAVGLNYADHVKEFGAERPDEPVIFMKPDSALLRENKPFFIPLFSNEIHYETEVLVRINRLGKNISERFAHRYYDEIGLGIDFTARDLQRKLKDAGRPWELSKAFDGSAVISEFVPISEFPDLQNVNFHLDINGQKVQSGNTRDMSYSIDQIIAYISRYFTLKIGDVIFTGTPAGVGPVAKNDRLRGYLEDKLMFDFSIK